MAIVHGRRFAGWALLTALALGLAPLARALEANTASQAELEQLKGVGVAMSERLLQARTRSPFTGWGDLMARVPGLGRRTAKRLSDQGLTVQGRAYPTDSALIPAPAAPQPSASAPQ